MAQTVEFDDGFEGGSTAVLSTPGTSWTVQNTVAIAGAFSLKRPAGNTARSIVVAGLAATQLSFRMYFRTSALQITSNTVLWREATSTTVRLVARLRTDQKIEVDATTSWGGSNTSGSIALAANTNYKLECVLDLAAGGVVKTWINDVLDVNTTHATGVSATDSVSFGTNVSPGGTGDWYFDDTYITKGGLTRVTDLLASTPSLLPPRSGNFVARNMR